MLKVFRNYIFILLMLFSFSVNALNGMALAATAVTSIGALGAVMAIATGAAPIVLAGSIALGVHGAILFLMPDGSPANSTSTPIQIHLDPNTPLITPSGWTSPTSPPSSATQNPYSWSWSSSSGTNATAAGACQDMLVPIQAFYTAGGAGVVATYKTFQSTNQCVYSRTQNGSAISDLVVTITPASCPAGYTISGTNCNLSTPTAVIKPESGIQEIKRVANTFSVDAQAHANDKLPATKLAVTSTSVTVNADDGSSTVVVINTDGTSKVTTTRPNSDNTSTKTVTDLSAPTASESPRVIGKSETVVTGVGTQAGTTPAPSTSSNLDISSLNKEATQSQILAKTTLIEDHTKNIEGFFKDDGSTLPTDTTEADKQKLTDETKKVTDKVTEYENEREGLEDSYLGYFNFVPSFPSGTCAPFTGMVHGFPVSLDACPAVEKLNLLLGWLLNLFAAWTIFNLAFTKEES